jgi:hypothetical protein
LGAGQGVQSHQAKRRQKCFSPETGGRKYR